MYYLNINTKLMAKMKTKKVLKSRKRYGFFY